MTPCPDCGAPLGGRHGCNAAFLALTARAAADAAYGYRRRAVVDAYCLQHPAYILSLKSFAAHLCGLCAATDMAGDPRAERAIWSNLSVPPDAVKPAIPEFRGSLTVADLHAAASAETFQRAADAWIADVWSAWQQHHALARAWLQYSIDALRSIRR